MAATSVGDKALGIFLGRLAKLYDKNQSTQGLILCGRTDATMGSQVIEKALNLWVAQRVRVLLIMKINKVSNPVKVGFFGFEAVMASAQLSTNVFDKR